MKFVPLCCRFFFQVRDMCFVLNVFRYCLNRENADIQTSDIQTFNFIQIYDYRIINVIIIKAKFVGIQILQHLHHKLWYFFSTHIYKPAVCMKFQVFLGIPDFVLLQLHTVIAVILCREQVFIKAVRLQ